MQLDPASAKQFVDIAASGDAARANAMLKDAKLFQWHLQNKNPNAAAELLKNRSSAIGGRPSQATAELSNILETQGADAALGAVNSWLGMFDPNARQGAKKAPFQRGEGGLVFNPNTGSYSVDPIAKQNFIDIAEKKQSKGGLGIKDKQSINKDITGFIKNSRAIKTTANDLDKLSELGTGPAAIAAVFKFMKANDPQSTVREGEFATAEQSAGIPLQVTNFYNKLVTGERVEGTQIKQFVETAKVLANSAISSASTEVGGYLNTFGDDLPSRFQKAVRERIPTQFKLKEEDDEQLLPIPPPAAPTLTSPGGIQFTVGD